MKSIVLIWLAHLRSSFWFTPVLMAVAAAALAIFLGVIWPEATTPLPVVPFLDKIGPENVRVILSTLAGSTITIAGAIFSITIVSLNMTSAQFGPGLIEKFLRAGATQITMGTFLACFVFCLFMLTLLPDVETRADKLAVMQISVAAAVSLGLLSFGVLIFFIQSTSRLLQARYIVFSLAEDALAVVRRVFKKEVGDCSELAEECARPIIATTSGYVQTIDKAKIIQAASRDDNIVRLDINVGEHILVGQIIGASQREDNELTKTVTTSIRTGVERTLAEDPVFAMQRITEVAVRCLSPGINDPYTAVACVDQLGRIINELRHFSEPGTCFKDESEKARLIMPDLKFEDIIKAAFQPIRENIGEQSQVRVRLKQLLNELAKNSDPCLAEGLKSELEALRLAEV